ncbi:hypothetical protein KIN20_022590 [Parelaphostrongylus tenuis]|uniref:Uncharacterized protein n=1 Tax=Parelaphostrongylus tenuis TaxID=148309 RepID=A0AAD5N854_PARTN|nr:hypothetical protein KIN20_022590 [Parelaphostrongylus tenuis]
MSSQPEILEYALVVTTASSTERPSSSLRVKYSSGREIRTTDLPMTVAKYAQMIEDQADIVSYIRDHGNFVK